MKSFHSSSLCGVKSIACKRDFKSWKYTSPSLEAVACRGVAMPGATAWLDAPLPNSSIEQWRLVIIVTGYKLFVTSQYDVIFTFAKQRFSEVCWHNMNIPGRRSSGREAAPSPPGAFGGLAPHTKLQDPSNWNMKHYKSVEFLSNFRMSTPREQM